MIAAMSISNEELNLTDSEVAFKHLSAFELKRAYFLFSLMRSPSLVKWGSSATSLALKLHLPIQTLVKKTLFQQFCGGETLDECAQVTEKLNAWNVGVIFDYAVEGKASESDFARSFEEVLRTIALVKKQGLPFIVFKMTAMASFALMEKITCGKTLEPEELFAWEKAQERVHRICETAHRSGVRVLIDAEESWIQGAIDELSLRFMREFNQDWPCVYITMQMYRNDRLDYLRKLHRDAEAGGYLLGVKLVRGAYLEKERNRASQLGYPSPLYARKKDTDRAYDQALVFCIENIETIAIFAGTHNEESTRRLSQLAEEHGLARGDERVVFSQLYGMSDNITFNLAHGGYKVLKYVPYGPVSETIPYLVRRAAENTAIQGQTGREWRMLQQELERRQKGGLA